MKTITEADKFIERAAPVLQRLETAGYEAWLVGGCVREALRRRAADEASKAGPEADAYTDLDVTTSARPEEVCRVFSDLTVIETGLKHGTVTVLVPEGTGNAEGSEGPAASDDPEGTEGPAASGRYPVEITTFRTEGKYSDGRHPDEVQFVTSLEADLRRRDFTVNAMAMDLRGNIEDPFGGQRDLKMGILRAVGDPETRFREDALRILRALRFASVLDFRIEEKTEAALFACSGLLRDISAERIFTELKKLICGKAAGDVLRRYIDISGEVIPELSAMKGLEQHNPYHKFNVLEHCIRALEEIRTVPENEEYMKLTALLHDIGKTKTYSEDEKGIGHFYGHPAEGARMAEQILRRLKADRFTIDRVTVLVLHHDLVFQEDPKLLKRWLNRYTPEVLLEILEIKRADNIATGNVSSELLEKFDRIEQEIRQILSAEDCFSIKDLAVNGRELIGCGIQEGPETGEMLRFLLDAVIDGQLPNEKTALLEAARKNLES